MPGTYLNSFYETKPVPYAEPGYGDPEVGKVMINVTNGKVIRLLVHDEPFDIRYGELRRQERVLDFRAGVLRREVEWVSPAGQAIRLARPGLSPSSIGPWQPSTTRSRHSRRAPRWSSNVSW